MTTRIERRFATLKEEGRAALVTFTMAGDPDYETSLAIAKALPKAGADVIELGMPFTDPMADGPAIQAAGLRALTAGQTLVKTLDGGLTWQGVAAPAGYPNGGTGDYWACSFVSPTEGWINMRSATGSTMRVLLR